MSNGFVWRYTNQKMSEKRDKTPDKRDGAYCFCIRKPKEEDKFKTSEVRLKNWEKWMVRRSDVHNKLARPLSRSAGELVMNVGDEYRWIQEEREVMLYTKLDTTFDKYRGNPEFWELPTGLADRCGARDPTYFTVKTKFERNEIPAIEYVRNPNYILTEKNVLPRTRNLYKLWKNSKYRNDQLMKLSSKVNLIEPHKPNCEELIIIGKKISPVEQKNNSIKQLQSEISSTFSAKKTFDVHSIPKLSFSINDITLSQDNILVNDIVKIRLIFECAANLKVPTTEYLTFQNKGVTTLRFYWTRIEKFRIFSNLTKSDREECQEFYFNKNELLLVPGMTIQFPIWFKAKEVGNYFQFWKITTLPRFWDDDFQLIVLLQGIVHMVGFEEKSKNIKDMLELRVRNTLIKDLLKNMLDNLKYTETDTTTFSFTEEHLFESANQEMWGAEKRSKYMYDKNIVNELKEFYREVKRPELPENWNYSIRELKIMTRKKDILDHVENKTKDAIKARERRRELKEMAAVEPQSAAKKPAPTKEKVVAIPDKNEELFQIQETRYNKLENILHKLERPLMIQNTEREKYFVVFIIMRTYLFKMCDALENYDNYQDYSVEEDYCPSYHFEKATSFDQIPERLVFERFEDIWLDGTKLIQPDSKIEFPVLPKPAILKDIPQEDTKMTYHTYFNIPIVDTTKKKDAKGGKKDSKGSKEAKAKPSKEAKGGDDKKKKGEAKAKEPPKRISTVKEGFDPYAEEYTPPITGENGESKPFPQTFVDKTECNYDKYLIVYTHLSEGIGAMIDALETYKENMIPVNTLGELTKCSRIYTAQEETPITEETPVIEEQVPEVEVATRTSEDELYFQYLLDSHLNKNIKTKKYIVHGRTRDSDVVHRESSSTLEVIEKVDSRVNVFRSHETIIESVYPSGSVSAGMQTSEVEEEYRQLSNVLLDQSTSRETLDTAENTVGERMSHDIFYFLEDSEDDLEVVGEKIQSSE